MALHFQVNPTGNSTHPLLPGHEDGHHRDPRASRHRGATSTDLVWEIPLQRAPRSGEPRNTWRTGYCFFLQRRQERFCFILGIGSSHREFCGALWILEGAERLFLKRIGKEGRGILSPTALLQPQASPSEGTSVTFLLRPATSRETQVRPWKHDTAGPSLACLTQTPSPCH